MKRGVFTAIFFVFSVLSVSAAEDPILSSLHSLQSPSQKLPFRRIDAFTALGVEAASCLVDKNRTELVIIYPGMTASQYSDESQSRAEIFYKAGYNVCIFSNSFRQGFYKTFRIVPGDLMAEGNHYWQATRSLLIQLKRWTRRVHFFSISYGTHILKEVLTRAHHEWWWQKKNNLRQTELGKAIFVSPPYALESSIQALDALWKVKFPYLRGVGTLPAVQISSELLSYVFRKTAISNVFPLETYQGFVLKLGFYQDMQNVAREILGDRETVNSDFTFEDYMKRVIQKQNPYSPVFVDGWEKIDMPILVVYAEDDFINSPENVSKFDLILERHQNSSLLKLTEGSHMGFINDPQVQGLMLKFLR